MGYRETLERWSLYTGRTPFLCIQVTRLREDRPEMRLSLGKGSLVMLDFIFLPFFFVTLYLTFTLGFAKLFSFWCHFLPRALLMVRI